MTNFITSQLFAQHGIQGIFSERQGGKSPPPFDSLNLGMDLGDDNTNIIANLERLCTDANIPTPHRSQQIHDTSIIMCSGEGIQHPAQADMLCTHTLGTSVAVRTADCLPILLVDANTNIACAVHAGWRGTAKNIARIAIKHMQKLGAHPEHILASLGPCILPCCFQVDTQTAKEIALCYPESTDYINIKEEKAWVNLQQINHLQLQDAGLKNNNIEHIALCTQCLPERFFSYRRDGLNSGRQLAIVALPSSL